jgi:hypothetical protein
MEVEPCRHRHTIQILQLIVAFAGRATPILIGPQNITMAASMSGRRAVAPEPRIRWSAALRREASTDWAQLVPRKRCASERRPTWRIVHVWLLATASRLLYLWRHDRPCSSDGAPVAMSGGIWTRRQHARPCVRLGRQPSERLAARDDDRPNHARYPQALGGYEFTVLP